MRLPDERTSPDDAAAAAKCHPSSTPCAECDDSFICSRHSATNCLSRG